MAAAAILNLGFWPYPCRHWRYLHQIWYT